MTEEKDKELIPPDYYGHPEDDDPLEEIIEDSDEDARIEKILNDEAADKQAQEQRRKEEPIRMADAPFNPQFGQSTFGGGTIGGNNTTLPWEQNKPQQQTTTWGGSWGNKGFGSGSQQKPWGTQQPSTPQVQGTIDCRTNQKIKKVIICDALDCLVESYDSAGKPGVIPRALWDLKPKLDVWEKIRSFNPEKVYIIFPDYRIIPSLGGQVSTNIALAYFRRSLSAYLRLPEIDCKILLQMQQHTPKDRILSGVVNREISEDILYVGVYSGKYGLSGGDLQAAHQVGIDYMDVFNLLQGYYIYE